MAFNISQKNYGINILKLLCCFLVVWIHLGVRGVNSNIAEITAFSDAFCRVAVPIFFIISGIYYERIKNIFDRIKSLIVLLIIPLMAHLVLMVIHGEKFDFFNIEWCVRLIIFNCLSPIAIHLWYILALIYSLVVIYHLEKHLKENLLFFIGFTLWLCSVFISYSQLNYMTRSWLFMGIPNIILGIFIARNYQPVKSKYLLGLIGIFVFLIFIEVLCRNHFFFVYSRDFLIFASPLGACLVVLFSTFSIQNEKFVTLNHLGDKLSGNIYLYHLIVFELISCLMPFNNIFLILLRPFIVFALCILMLLFKDMIFCKSKQILYKKL